MLETCGRLLSQEEPNMGKTGLVVGGMAKHFAHLCRDCGNSNQVKAKLKEIMEPSILWKGDRIKCMKSAKIMNCKICMVERT